MTKQRKMSPEGTELLNAVEQMKAGKKGRVYTPEQLLAISARQSVSLTQHGTASAVVQDFQTHQRLQEPLLMLKLMAQGEANIPAERTHSPGSRVRGHQGPADDR